MVLMQCHCRFLLPPLPSSAKASSSSASSSGSHSAIHRISHKLRHLGYLSSSSSSASSFTASPSPSPSPSPPTSTPGHIFIPTPPRLPPFRLASTLLLHRPSPSPSLAQLSLPPHELRRLRTLGIQLRSKLRIGKPGITEGILHAIRERWKRSELVKIKCHDLSRLNMNHTHHLLEAKTGGLVVWRSGSIIILYRGPRYNFRYFPPPPPSPSHPPLLPASPHSVRLQLPGEAKLALEADRLLHGLGPRFLQWPGLDPKPVDADLLPGLVIGFRKPFRVLPFGIKQGLTDSEMTTLRRLARPLPPHFALGRTTNLQGLAHAIIKLWEKCEIAKIALKKPLQTADSDIIIDELKKLTGGTLLSRDNQHITFYRGKDFLPLAVSTAIERRRNNTPHIQEESHEDTKISSSEPDDKEMVVTEMHKKQMDEVETNNLKQMDAVETNNLQAKLSLATMKKEKAEKLLEELESASDAPREVHEKEAISEEERHMLRKVGLAMKTFLLMGRKGVFDGTVENMHLHWKYRELVKIISKEKDIKEVEKEARILESESGGILVAVERVRKGHAIIMYRGKNYQRPKTLRPKSLPSKREAMKYYLEAQRRQSLKLHLLGISRNTEELEQLMNKDQASSSHSVQKSSVHMEDSRDATSSINDNLDASKDNSEDMLIFTDVIGNACEAPSLGTSKEVFVVNSKLEASIQPTDIQPGADVCSTSGISSHEEENLDKAGRDEMPFKAAPLSNKERLVLRKQALKMRKRPVLAIGRNNVITGVAKTIKTHFQKHPLAVVDIKNRADGTSVQQLIRELEEATGAVFVSREPNKVILYRGWADGEEAGDKKKEEGTKLCRGENGKPTSMMSTELMEAIRMECGLKFNSPTEDK